MRPSRFLLLSLLPLLPSTAAVAQARPDLTALATIHSLAQIGGFVKDWCDARAPKTKPTTDKGLAEWRRAFRLDEIETRFGALDSNQRSQIDSAIETKRADAFRGLDKGSRNPANDCDNFEQYLRTEVNPEKLYPREYALALAGTSADGPPSKVVPGPATGSAAGTVYTLAQLGFLADNASRGRSNSKAALEALGTIFVTGTLEKPSPRSDVVFLNSVDETWRSRYGATCYDLSLDQLYSKGTREVVLRGQVRDVYSTVIQLEECQVIPSATRLTPATVADRGGAFRIPIRPERIITSPNQGIAVDAIEGIVWDAGGVYTVTGYQFQEHTYLLLRDGWLYDNLRFSPRDLDVTTSRKLEPHHWGEWKREGGKLMVRWRDQWNQPLGTWKSLGGDLKAPLAGRTSLVGSFETRSATTLGTTSFGTTSTSSSGFTFGPDGRYQYRSSQLTTGTSNVGTGQDGSSGTAISGNAALSFGPNGTNSSAFGSQAEEGSYSIDGYTLEFRNSKGGTSRTFAFPWDNAKYRDHVVIGGTTYTLAGRK